jgi:hypothetical protein
MVFEISIYLLICLICGILLIVMGMFGFGDFGDFDFDTGDVDIDTGDFDLDHGDMGGLSPLSLPIMLSFGTSFGAFGVIFSSMDFDVVLVPILSAVISVGIAGLMFFLMVKVFIQTQVNTSVNMATLVGREATVSISIKPPEVGQIMVTPPERGRTLLTASAEDYITSGMNVTIVRMVGSTAHVIKKEGLVE